MLFSQNIRTDCSMCKFLVDKRWNLACKHPGVKCTRRCYWGVYREQMEWTESSCQSRIQDGSGSWYSRYVGVYRKFRRGDPSALTVDQINTWKPTLRDNCDAHNG